MKPIIRFRQANSCLRHFVKKNSLKQGDASLPLIFNSALKYAIRKVHANKEGLNLNSTHIHLLLVYADHSNFLG
jgi:hypothetical protein